MMNYQILLSDIDDTILKDSLTVSKKDRETVRLLEKKGFPFVLSSGRPIAGIYPIAKKLYNQVDQQLAISFNGAVVSRYGDKKQLFSSPLSVEVSHELFRLAREFQITAQVYTDHGFCVEKETQRALLYQKVTGVPMQVVGDLIAFTNYEPAKILFHALPQTLKAVESYAKEIGENRFTMVYSKPQYLEFFHPHVSKGKAVEFLCNYLGIPLSGAIAVGDNYNDIEMIQTVGLGLAVANGCTLLKEKAKQVLPCSNNESPISYIYRQFIASPSL